MTGGTERIEVELACGRVAGTRRAGTLHFAGIPYAEAPVGELRFQPPAPVKPWTSVLDARAPSPIAPQLASRLAAVMGDFERQQSEDCLRLTIATPAIDSGRRPVVVWLHGGGFSSGSGGLDWYDGGMLAAEGDVVVVGVNYRLGAFGYLCADGVSPGNLGLLDQALALQFIRQNIATFGGDPANLTLMGQSAGGNSIMALFADEHDVSGVRRVIVQSAAFGMAPRLREPSRRAGAEFLRRLGSAPADATVAAILEAQAGIAGANARYGDTEPAFQLVQTDRMNEKSPFHVVAADAMDGVDVLLGVTGDEAEAFLALNPQTRSLTDEGAGKLIIPIYGTAAAERYATLRRQHPAAPAGKLFSRLVSEEIFITPARTFIDRRLARGGAVYLYDFAWQPPGSPLGSCHCLELPFVFGPSAAWQDAPMLAGADAGEVATLSASMRAAWLAFVRTGNPATPSLPAWPAVAPGAQHSMRLERSSRLQRFGGEEG